VSGKGGITPALIIGEQKNDVRTWIRLAIIPGIFCEAAVGVQKNRQTADSHQSEAGPTVGERLNG
jgi:hypothetical protein